MKNNEQALRILGWQDVCDGYCGEGLPYIHSHNTKLSNMEIDRKCDNCEDGGITFIYESIGSSLGDNKTVLSAVYKCTKCDSYLNSVLKITELGRFWGGWIDWSS